MFRVLVTLSTLVLSALASPAARTTCTPNFQGQAQTISTPGGALEWTAQSIYPGAQFTLQPGSSALGEFFVQFTGQPDNSYNFRLQAETNAYTALTVGPNYGELSLGLLDLSTSEPSQRFTISCSTCPSTNGGVTYAQGCIIENPGTGLCVVGSDSGQTLSLGSCAWPGVYEFTGSV